MPSGESLCNARYRKCRPSGRKKGNACRVSPAFVSTAVTAEGVPPAAETRARGDALPGVNRITLSGFHDPCNDCVEGTSHSVSAGPPDASILLSLPPAMNATNRLSGDQNGE